MNNKLFISHSSEDDGFVRKLREKLSDLGEGAWIDSRELRGGDPLESEIKKCERIQYIIAQKSCYMG